MNWAVLATKDTCAGNHELGAASSTMRTSEPSATRPGRGLGQEEAWRRDVGQVDQVQHLPPAPSTRWAGQAGTARGRRAVPQLAAVDFGLDEGLPSVASMV